MKKRIQNRKKNARKGKHQSHVRYDDSSSEEESEKGDSEEESDSEQGGNFYLRFKEGIPPLVKKDMACEDLWLLMKRPLVTNQNLSEVPDMIYAKSEWHFHNK